MSILDEYASQPVHRLSDCDPLWSALETADFLGVPTSTLYYWRYRGIGPRGIRIGRYLRYDPEAIRRWVEFVDRIEFGEM